MLFRLRRSFDAELDGILVSSIVTGLSNVHLKKKLSASSEEKQIQIE